MIILGTQEPPMSGPRQIRREDVKLQQLLEGCDAEHPNVVITVPSCSIMVAIAQAPDMVGRVSIYYECDPFSPTVDDVELIAITNEQVEPGFRLIGHFWNGSLLVAIYAKATTRS